MLYIIFLQQIHVVHVTVRFILLQLQLQAFRTPEYPGFHRERIFVKSARLKDKMAQIVFRRPKLNYWCLALVLVQLCLQTCVAHSILTIVRCY